MATSDSPKTIKTLENTAREANRRGDMRTACDTWLELANQYHRIGRIPQMLDAATNARDAASDPERRATALVSLSIALNMQCSWQRSVEAANEYFELRNNRQETYDDARVFNARGASYLSLQSYDAAIRDLKEARRLFRAFRHLADGDGYAQVTLNLSRVYYHAGDRRRSIQCVNEAISVWLYLSNEGYTCDEILSCARSWKSRVSDGSTEEITSRPVTVGVEESVPAIIADLSKFFHIWRALRDSGIRANSRDLMNYADALRAFEGRIKRIGTHSAQCDYYLLRIDVSKAIGDYADIVKVCRKLLRITEARRHSHLIEHEHRLLQRVSTPALKTGAWAACQLSNGSDPTQTGQHAVVLPSSHVPSSPTGRVNPTLSRQRATKYVRNEFMFVEAASSRLLTDSLALHRKTTSDAFLHAADSKEPRDFSDKNTARHLREDEVLLRYALDNYTCMAMRLFVVRSCVGIVDRPWTIPMPDLVEAHSRFLVTVAEMSREIDKVGRFRNAALRVIGHGFLRRINEDLQRLGSLLFPDDLANQLWVRGVRRIHIVQEALTSVPFCALRVPLQGKIQPLIGHSVSSEIGFEVSMAPSATVFVQARRIARDNLDQPLDGPSRIGIFCGPDHNDLDNQTSSFEPIANDLQMCVPGPTRTDIFVGEPSRTKFIDLMHQCDVFVFFGHGEENSIDPLSSCLIIAKADHGPEKLSVLDLLTEQPKTMSRAPIVVHAACFAASVDESSESHIGEQIGFIPALLRRGARAVLGSQWKSYVEPTRHLLSKMISALVAGSSLRASLRIAQLETASNPSFTNPLFWSAFTVFGDGGARVRSGDQKQQRQSTTLNHRINQGTTVASRTTRQASFPLDAMLPIRLTVTSHELDASKRTPHLCILYSQSLWKFTRIIALIFDKLSKKSPEEFRQAQRQRQVDYLIPMLSIGSTPHEANKHVVDFWIGLTGYRPKLRCVASGQSNLGLRCSHALSQMKSPGDFAIGVAMVVLHDDNQSLEKATELLSDSYSEHNPTTTLFDRFH